MVGLLAAGAASRKTLNERRRPLVISVPMLLAGFIRLGSTCCLTLALVKLAPFSVSDLCVLRISGCARVSM
jgi:hypothetical protein